MAFSPVHWVEKSVGKAVIGVIHLSFIGGLPFFRNSPSSPWMCSYSKKSVIGKVFSPSPPCFSALWMSCRGEHLFTVKLGSFSCRGSYVSRKKILLVQVYLESRILNNNFRDWDFLFLNSPGFFTLAAASSAQRAEFSPEGTTVSVGSSLLLCPEFPRFQTPAPRSGECSGEGEGQAVPQAGWKPGIACSWRERQAGFPSRGQVSLLVSRAGEELQFLAADIPPPDTHCSPWPAWGTWDETSPEGSQAKTFLLPNKAVLLLPCTFLAVKPAEKCCFLFLPLGFVCSQHVSRKSDMCQNWCKERREQQCGRRRDRDVAPPFQHQWVHGLLWPLRKNIGKGTR